MAFKQNTDKDAAQNPIHIRNQIWFVKSIRRKYVFDLANSPWENLDKLLLFNFKLFSILWTYEKQRCCARWGICWKISCKTLSMRNFLRPGGRMVGWVFMPCIVPTQKTEYLIALSRCTAETSIPEGQMCSYHDMQWLNRLDLLYKGH